MYELCSSPCSTAPPPLHPLCSQLWASYGGLAGFHQHFTRMRQNKVLHLHLLMRQVMVTKGGESALCPPVAGPGRYGWCRVGRAGKEGQKGRVGDPGDVKNPGQDNWGFCTYHYTIGKIDQRQQKILSAIC